MSALSRPLQPRDFAREPSSAQSGGGLSWHKCWEIAKYPTKGVQVTQALAPGIGVVPSANRAPLIASSRRRQRLLLQSGIGNDGSWHFARSKDCGRRFLGKQ